MIVIHPKPDKDLLNNCYENDLYVKSGQRQFFAPNNTIGSFIRNLVERYCIENSNKKLPHLRELDLQQSYLKLLEEKKNVSKVMKFDRDLTEGVINGKHIVGILDIVEKQTNHPVIVEDRLHQVTDIKGITIDEYEPIKKEFHSYLKRALPLQGLTEINHSTYNRLVTPIFLQQKIVGYCSFLYEKNKQINYEMDSMILHRVSSICSFILLNEKIELDSKERIKGHLFEEILNGKYHTEQEILKKAFFINLDFTDGYYAIYLKYKMPTNYQDPSYHNEIFDNITKYMSIQEIPILIGQKTDSLLIILPKKQLGNKTMDQVIHPLLTYLKRMMIHTTWFVGISSKHRSILDEVNEACKEAYTAVKLSTREIPITYFHELGILGVLINDENKKAIRKIAELTLGDLYNNLDPSKVELIETLYVFLNKGGNYEVTAEHLSISISGLRYRLNKIAIFLGHDFREAETRFQLLLTLKALILLEDEWLKIIE